MLTNGSTGRSTANQSEQVVGVAENVAAGFDAFDRASDGVQAPNSTFGHQRRTVVALFCDLRGFTAFANTAEPEDILALLNEYHDRLGPLIEKYRGTVYHYFGDGGMLLFKDRQPCPDAALRVSQLAIEMRDSVGLFIQQMGKRGHILGFGVGIAEGHAVLAHIGCKGSSVYTAIGRTVNLASRLCGEALDGQVLVSGRVARAIETSFDLEPLGQRTLKGFSTPIMVSNVQTTTATIRP
jgi:class 3 adenylate cyclase